MEDQSLPPLAPDPADGRTRRSPRGLFEALKSLWDEQTPDKAALIVFQILMVLGLSILYDCSYLRSFMLTELKRLFEQNGVPVVQAVSP